MQVPWAAILDASGKNNILVFWMKHSENLDSAMSDLAGKAWTQFYLKDKVEQFHSVTAASCELPEGDMAVNTKPSQGKRL